MRTHRCSCNKSNAYPAGCDAPVNLQELPTVLFRAEYYVEVHQCCKQSSIESPLRTVSGAGDVHLVHGREIIHPVKARAMAFIVTRQQQVRLVRFLRGQSRPSAFSSNTHLGKAHAQFTGLRGRCSGRAKVGRTGRPPKGALGLQAAVARRGRRGRDEFSGVGQARTLRKAVAISLRV